MRSVPHPVPLLGIEGDPTPAPGPAVRRAAVGAHELIFGEHDGLDAPLLAMARARVSDLQRDRRLRGFGLCRVAAQASHVTWQLMAFPHDFAPTACAAWRDMELRERARVVAESPGGVALAAWAPLAPFETWILSREGVGGFATGDDDVPLLLREVLGRLERVLGATTLDLSVADGEPWRLVIRPRVRQEAAAAALGVAVVGLFPEVAAKLLRD